MTHFKTAADIARAAGDPLESHRTGPMLVDAIAEGKKHRPYQNGRIGKRVGLLCLCLSALIVIFLIGVSL